MQWLEYIPAWPALLVILLLANRLLILPGARAPLIPFAILLQRLAKRVHPDISRSVFQQKLSGGLALLLITTVPLAITYSLYLISEWPLILDVLILYFCLAGQQPLQHANKVVANLNRHQLNLARAEARPLLLRDRQNLSAMGLSKACTESLIMQQAANQVAIIGWFLLGGGLLVLAFTLLQTAARQWNSKLPHYHHFGRPAAVVYQLAQAPGQLASALLLALQTGILPAWRNYRATTNHYFNWPGRVLLAAAASALNTTLGGPAYYGGIKIVRQQVGTGQAPDAAVILRAILIVKAQQTALILLLSCIVALSVAGRLLLP